MSKATYLLGLFLAIVCGYGMLVALGLLEFGDHGAGPESGTVSTLVIVPLGALAMLLVGGAWEIWVLPGLGRVVKRVWPGYDGAPAPLTLWHVAAIVGIALALLGALYLYWSL